MPIITKNVKRDNILELAVDMDKELQDYLKSKRHEVIVESQEVSDVRPDNTPVSEQHNEQDDPSEPTEKREQIGNVEIPTGIPF